jgi:diguanylate cyclase (GGDEF)-like protein
MQQPIRYACNELFRRHVTPVLLMEFVSRPLGRLRYTNHPLKRLKRIGVASSKGAGMRTETERTEEVAVGVDASSRIYACFLFCYGVLSAAHLVVLARDHTAQLIASYVVFGLIQWLTIAALIWRWRRSVFPDTFRLGLLIVGMVCVHLANDIDLVRALDAKYNLVPGASIFCDAIYAALVVLSCSTTFRKGTVRVANLIDGAMAVALIALFFIRIFSIISLNGSDSSDNVLFIIRMFDALGIFMTLCAFVRLFGAEEAARRHFFFMLGAYLLISTVFAAVRNRLLFGPPNAYRELLLLPSLVVLGVSCLRPLPGWLRSYRPVPSLTYVAESLSPLFLGMGLLGISISIWNGHPQLGAAGVTVAVLGYGIRNIITQSDQMATERSLRDAQAELQILVVTDPLTGIANRRGFDAALQRMWNRVQNSNMQLSILMMDIDHFKRFNDTHGHAAGDACLITVAACLDRILTPLGCFVGRNGGEEFVALLPATTLEQAIAIGETVRQSIAAIQISGAGEPLYITTSIGLANSGSSNVATGKNLLLLADEALFDAKSRGRNQVSWPAAGN